MTHIERISKYVDMNRKKPIKMAGDIVHSVHMGTEWEAVLKLSDIQKLLSEHRENERIIRALHTQIAEMTGA